MLSYNAKLKLGELIFEKRVIYFNTTNLKRWLRKNDHDIKKVGELILLFKNNSIPTNLYTEILA